MFNNLLPIIFALNRTAFLASTQTQAKSDLSLNCGSGCTTFQRNPSVDSGSGYILQFGGFVKTEINRFETSLAICLLSRAYRTSFYLKYLERHINAAQEIVGARSRACRLSDLFEVSAKIMTINLKWIHSIQNNNISRSLRKSAMTTDRSETASYNS